MTFCSLSPLDADINFDKVQRIGAIVYSIGLQTPDLLAFPFAPEPVMFASLHDEIQRAQPGESLMRYLNDVLQRRLEDISDDKPHSKARVLQCSDENGAEQLDDEDLFRAIRLKKTEEVRVEFTLPVNFPRRQQASSLQLLPADRLYDMLYPLRAKMAQSKDTPSSASPTASPPSADAAATAAATVPNSDAAPPEPSGEQRINLKRVKSVHMLASNTLTVAQIKDQLLEEGAKLLVQYALVKNTDEAKALLGTADSYCLKVVGVDEYLTNETLPLYPCQFQFQSMSLLLLLLSLLQLLSLLLLLLQLQLQLQLQY